MLALIGYPLVIEPRYDLSTQARLWTIGYAIFAVLSGACAFVVWRAARARQCRRLPRRSRPTTPLRPD